jgi:hypothetical protein
MIQLCTIGSSLPIACASDSEVGEGFASPGNGRSHSSGLPFLASVLLGWSPSVRGAHTPRDSTVRERRVQTRQQARPRRTGSVLARQSREEDRNEVGVLFRGDRYVAHLLLRIARSGQPRDSTQHTQRHALPGCRGPDRRLIHRLDRVRLRLASPNRRIQPRTNAKQHSDRTREHR